MSAPPTISATPVLPLEAPAWLDALCPAPAEHAGGSRFELRLAQSGRDGAAFARASARVKNALHLSAADIEAQVEAMYAEMFAALAQTCAPHPVRFWNGLPRIIEGIEPPADENAAWERAAPVHEKFDRYMAFNAGRCRAFLGHYGSREALARAVPAGTGVGHGGADLVVHALSAAAHGAPVENPRQTPAWRYSPRFGPLPPCFARATQLDRGRLLVSGTASIAGEETLHAGDLAAQVAETFRNLESLLGAAGLPLGALCDARIYAARPQDLQPTLALCRQHLPSAAWEIVHAEICRPGLLLEIEGITAP